MRQEEMRWLDENREYLERIYPGKWLAVHGRELLAVGDSVKEVRKMARKKGVENPFVEAVTAREYQGVVMFRKWL